ncbi:ABC transporter permease [Planosporangium thailandense]|uniref:ABC transporter permease n=1 Tax=Planosporangium thailandense TaxID=765197 RepID=A0ABX0XRE4_9ACTN|nr:FtsX-like permease family protein [Planosporangium thailandense]NJC68467.1 ABC transporter permease [Planosporangium thailandense]
MLKLTLASLRAHALRLVLSSLAIVLGVAFIAGTLMVTDGMRAASYAKAGTFDRHTDAAVYPAGQSVMDEATLSRVRATNGVRAAEGEVSGSGGVLGSNGRPVLGYAVVESIPVDPALQSYRVARGRLPMRAGEAVLDTRTVDKQHFTLGSAVRIGGGDRPAAGYTLVGVVDVAGTSKDVGGPFIGLVAADALGVTGAKGYDRIVVAGSPGVSRDALAKRVAVAVGAGLTVKTHQQVLDANLKDAVRNVAQFNTVLLMFAAISVLVAAFVIANTFTIVLAQRARETALLRLVGATRGQAFRSVLLESVAVGLFASLAGVAVGAATAMGMQALLRTMGQPMEGGPVLTLSTVVLSVGIGTVVTVGAAVVPAWRGTRVPPVAALSDAAVEMARPPARVRLGAGAVSLAAGAAAIGYAGKATSIAVVGAGAVFTFTGVVLFGPVLVPALVRVLGWPLRRVLGATAAIAVSNAVRNPRRIAATATALVIGIGLVSSFVVSAQSAKAGIERSVDRKVGADYLVVGVGTALPAPLVDDLRHRREFGLVYLPRQTVTDGVEVTSAHPALVGGDLKRVVEGDVRALGAGTALVYGPLARARGLHVGSTATVAGRAFRVVAVVEGTTGPTDPIENVPPGYRIALSDADFSAAFPDVPAVTAAVNPAAGVSRQRAQDALDSIVAKYPTANVMDRAAYKKMLTGTVDMLLAFVTALLGLAVVIALVGVANTLTLSVVERTRENGVLRAVGMTAGRMRAMLAVEAVLMALVGAVLGVGLGTAVSAAAMNFLNGMGGEFTVAVPWGRLGLILGVAAVAALAASVLPARRAVRRPVVEALGVE